MKYRICSLAVLLLVQTSGLTGPLQKDHIPADAKWLFHLDLDGFRETKLGAYVAEEFLNRAAAEVREHLKFDFGAVYQKIHSITGYGTDYDMGKEVNGVLLVNAEAEASKVVEGFLAAGLLQQDEKGLKKLQQEPYPLYVVDKLFLAPRIGDCLILGKSREQIAKTADLLAGKGKTSAGAKAFGGFPDLANSFFFFGVAEGFGEGLPVPPQAKVLKMADGGRLALGENAERLVLNLALRGKTAEVATQIRQILEGLLALVSLGQPEHQPWLPILQSAKVGAANKLVSLQLEFPVTEAIQHLGGQTKKKKPAKQAKVELEAETAPEESGAKKNETTKTSP